MEVQEQLNVDYVLSTISNQEINEAIRRLQVDHIGLEKGLHELIKVTQDIVEKEGSIRSTETLQKLRQLATCYQQQLDEHAQWEEETLFPILALYFAEDVNKLTQMEQEHVLTEQFIQAFVDAVERAAVRKHDEQEMLSYLNQAASILNAHFDAEEEVLFTMLDLSHIYGY